MKFAKSIVILILVFIIGIEGYYRYVLSYVAPNKVEHEVEYNKKVQDVMWVSTGETEQIETHETSATSLIFNYLLLVFKYDILNLGDDDFKESIPKGLPISAMVGDDIFFKKFRGNRHLERGMVAVWVTNHYSATEALNYVLNSSYFGYEKHTLAGAARFYFDKTEEELNLSEIITLITITQGPSAYNPYCNPERIEKRAAYLLKQLNLYDTESYGGYSFQFPMLIKRADIHCSDNNS